MKRFILLSVLLTSLTGGQAFCQRPAADKKDAEANEKIFSGPQPGEKMAPFRVRGVFDEDAGKELDFVTQAAGKPLVLIFVHDVNRPSIGLTRVLTSYTVGRSKDGLSTGVVWLEDDATEAENRLKRSRHALTPGAPTGISLDGQEGPGSYGLNRNVTLTILVGKEGRVTANFALVQPSLQADLPKILEAVVQVAGGRVPKLEEIAGVSEMMKRPGEATNLRSLLQPVIQKTAEPEQVDRAAKAVEDYASKNEAARKEIGRIATTIVNGGKLSTYGTPRAQEYLRKWASEYGEKAKSVSSDREKK